MTRTRNAINRRNSTLSFLARCVTSLPGRPCWRHRPTERRLRRTSISHYRPCHYHSVSAANRGARLVFLRHISSAAACSSLTHTSRDTAEPRNAISRTTRGEYHKLSRDCETTCCSSPALVRFVRVFPDRSHASCVGVIRFDFKVDVSLDLRDICARYRVDFRTTRGALWTRIFHSAARVFPKHVDPRFVIACWIMLLLVTYAAYSEH